MARRWKNKSARKPSMSTMMRKVSHPFRRHTRPGDAPGTLVVDPQAPKPVVSVIAYGPGPNDFYEKTYAPGGFDGLPALVDRYSVTWVNVDGLGDADVIQGLGTLCGLHPLALEDVVHVHQRSKVEDYEDYLFVVARMVGFEWPADGAEASAGRQSLSSSSREPRVESREQGSRGADAPRSPDSEQVSLFLGKKYVLTFQERPGTDSLEPVRNRLRRRRGRFLELGSDYLAYALIDAIIDGYFPVLEELGGRLERLDADVLSSQGGDHLTRLHRLRGDLLMLRKYLLPQREAIHALIRDPHPLVCPETHLFLRDCYDHTVQLLDVVETYRELCADLREYHYSQLSSRTNEVVKTLTIISTIFIPLSFVAGVYGMNFDPDASPYNMPELRARFGYPGALAFMGAVGLGLLWWMWSKGWLRRDEE